MFALLVSAALTVAGVRQPIEGEAIDYQGQITASIESMYDSLKWLDKADDQEAVRQWLIRYANPKSELEWIGLMLMLRYFDEADLIAIIDEQLQHPTVPLRGIKKVRDAAEWRHERIDEPNFDNYERYLRRHYPEQPPAHLLRWMLWSDPDKALEALNDAYHPMDEAARRSVEIPHHEYRDIIWRRHMDLLTEAEAAERSLAHLTALAEHPDWWVRCYAAVEVLDGAGHETFRGLAEQLRQDPHPEVRWTMANGNDDIPLPETEQGGEP